MENPLISIITVSYNSSKTIEHTILSVLYQTYAHIEYIIIDGGSTDGTIDIIKKYESRISCWVSEPDNGIYDAMNKGINRANGELIGIINSDDWYELDAVSLAVNAFLKNPKTDVFHAGVRLYNDERFSVNYCPKTKELALHMLPHPSCFINRNAYIQFGVFDTSYSIAADYEFLVRIYKNKGKFCFLNKINSNLRLGGISTTKKEAGDKEVEVIRSKYNFYYKPTCFYKLKRFVKKIIK